MASPAGTRPRQRRRRSSRARRTALQLHAMPGTAGFARTWANCRPLCGPTPTATRRSRIPCTRRRQ
eukprot:10892790-Alexandrium_andersonii.AAC.1